MSTSTSGVMVAGILAALASNAWAGGQAGSHVHAIGNANAGATAVAASQTQTGFLSAQTAGEVTGKLFLHGTVANYSRVQVASANTFGSGSASANTVVGGYTVISRSIFTYNSSAAVAASAQQNFTLSTVWGTYVVGPFFVTTWTQASGAFAGELAVTLTPVGCGSAANTTVINTFGNAGASAGAWSGLVLTTSFAMGFHAVTYNAALLAAWCDGSCPPGYFCTCNGVTAGSSAVAFAPAQVVLVLQAAYMGMVWTNVVANASLSNYAVVLIGSAFGG